MVYKDMDASLSSRAEALLFAEGGPLSKKKLVQLLACNPEELEAALAELSTRLSGGVSLIRTETECALAIASGAAQSVKEAQEGELGKEIGDAGLEVLAIVLYRGPSTRAQIDYIRGVNTSSTVRNLLARGLLERAGNPADGREYLYRPTAELLAHLGVKDGQELPEYGKISSELAAFLKKDEPFTEGHAHAADTNNDGEGR